MNPWVKRRGRNCRQSTFVHVQLIAVHKYSQSLTRKREAQAACLGVKSSLSSQRHVSHVAAFTAEHSYTISLTYITCFPIIFSGKTHGGVAPQVFDPKVTRSDDFEPRRN